MAKRKNKVKEVSLGSKVVDLFKSIGTSFTGGLEEDLIRSLNEYENKRK